jgi:hypothetical protein
MLINWFHDPGKYQWMSIEGIRELGHVKSLDDVTCLTSHGEYELYQVKFTTDSDRDDLQLDFDWLLKKRPRGTSLIEKWSADIEMFGTSGVISTAKLITNRKPDEILSSCLVGNKVDYNLIPEGIKSKIIEQLGDRQTVTTFFEYLIFEHSQAEIDDLEHQLQDCLVPDHANNESWLQLLKTVERWATRKNEPAPDGKIYLDHIHEILSLGFKKTISQFFEVPGGYIPPIEEFHQQIIEIAVQPGCHVVFGLPGMGKSTYLSFLTDQLIENKTPVVRHHYYLSPQFIGDRIAYNNAAQSLQSQIKTLYPFDFDSDKFEPQEFESWISKAAEKAAETDQTLVVIVDGLDHVYRERSDISQLEHLVNRLEPLKDKVCLIFGTQPISDEYLPNSLLRSAPRDTSWIDIPAMGLDAIKSRLDFLVSSEEIDVVGEDDHQLSEVVEISQALLDISHGYPLHIIYSLNSVILDEKTISRYDVERLPTCTEGDIHAYYENLWVSLSESAKEILLLIAIADFSWPDKTHLNYCFEDGLFFQNSFSEIQHLVEQRLSGITPFHSSLFVFVKRKNVFIQSRDRLNRISQTWINQHAPEYWKWGWNWIVEANLGNSAPLLEGVTREWLIHSLCQGYPLEHIEHIFNTAEHFAFQEKLYPELLRLRILKMRLLNGPEFQIQKFGEFLDCSLSCSEDTFGLLWRADNLRIISNNEIVIVAKHFQGKDERIVNACAKEIFRRIRFYARLEDANHDQILNSLVDDYLQVLVSFNNPDLTRINDFLERLSDKSSSFNRIVELLIQNGHRHLLLDLTAFEIPEDCSSNLGDEIVLAAIIENVALDKNATELDTSDSNFGLLNSFLSGEDITAEELEELQCPSDSESVSHRLFQRHFFNTLVSSLKNLNEPELAQLEEPENIQEFLNNTWQTLEFAATTTAADIKAGKGFNISSLYESFSALEQPDQYRMGYQINSILFDIRKSLSTIAIHLNVICNSIDDFSALKKDQFSVLKENFWWNSRIFLDTAAENSIYSFSKEVLSKEFSILMEAELNRRDDTSTLANDSLDLAKLACTHGLYDEAAKFLKRTALNIVGYGHRKDITLHEVFEAIQECSDSDCPQVSQWLKRVAAFTTDVFEFSEREIQHIPRWFTKLLSKHSPERLVDEFDYHLAEENWDRTHLIIESAVKSFPLTTQAEHSFLRCMTTFDALTALKERAGEDSTLEEVYAEQCDTLGGMPPPPRERSSTEIEETPVCPDVTTLHPDNLDSFRTTLNSVSYTIREKFIADWIAHWIEQEMGSAILNSFSEYYEQEKSDYELNRCLHSIFLLSKKLEGKSVAYKWAVRNVKLSNCWSRYTYSGSEESLREYGITYSNDWEKLLLDTMGPSSSSLQEEGNIIVPSTQLVTYLIAAGQTDLAAGITEVMVCSLEGDIAHLPLTELYWYENPVTEEAVPLHLLYLHYKWPDRYARLLSAKQIAFLLEDANHVEFRSLYLHYLSNQFYEVDIVDYLSVLLLLDETPFSKEEIIGAVNFPSLASDELLIRLGFLDEDRTDLPALYSEFPDGLVPNRAKYDKYANGLALRFISVIQELEKEFGASLVNHYLLEWEQIQERHSCYIFDPHSFCRDQFYPQDKIRCSFSWAAEASILSAYVRTLAHAIDQHFVPREVGLSHAQEVLPFGSIGVNLSPSAPPSSWPQLEDIDKEDSLPAQNELEKYLSDIADSDETLLHANGPVLRNHTGVCLDLRVILVSLQDSEIADPKSMFDSIDHVRNKEEGIFPLAKMTWPSSFGRWEFDWLSRGYFRPTYSVGDLPVSSVTQDESSVEYFGGSVSNGVWRYWVKQWYPVHQGDVGNSIGTYMTVSSDFFSMFKDHFGGEFYLIAEMTCIDRRDFMRDEEPKKTFAILPV